jgi:hypothetical protein
LTEIDPEIRAELSAEFRDAVTVQGLGKVVDHDV